MFFHEQLHRSSETMHRLRSFRVTVCGAGALGGNIAESLARAGFGALSVIDRDRIEERNLSTQPYTRADIGAFKSMILANMLYCAVGVKVDSVARELKAENVGRMLRNSDLVIDVFDNSESRRIVTDWCSRENVPCLHAGLADGYAEVLWNEQYRVPSPVNDDVCDYPLARNLVLLTTAVACETVIGFVATGEKGNWTITFDDLMVQPLIPSFAQLEIA